MWLDFVPQRGCEQSGRRPAFVLSPKAYNEQVGLGIFYPITEQIKGCSFLDFSL
ncbi:MAG: type II toxin-antitoxin system PemK/MazF family toxin [Syntrophobacteraceae bacterium]